MDAELLTTAEAAKRLGIIPRRVVWYITEGRLPARKVGRDWVIRADDLDRLERKPPGNHSGKPRGRAAKKSEQQEGKAR